VTRRRKRGRPKTIRLTVWREPKFCTAIDWNSLLWDLSAILLDMWSQTGGREVISFVVLLLA